MILLLPTLGYIRQTILQISRANVTQCRAACFALEKVFKFFPDARSIAERDDTGFHY